MKTYFISIFLLLQTANFVLCHDDMDMTGKAWSNPFPDFSTKALSDNSIVSGLVANINGQQVGNILMNFYMGTTHPPIWDPTHCVQVPYMPNAREKIKIKTCDQQTEWYFDVSTKTCLQTTLPCTAMATLNFFATIHKCNSMCFDRKGNRNYLLFYFL